MNVTEHTVLSNMQLFSCARFSSYLSTIPEVIPTHEDLEVVAKVTRELKGYVTCLEGLR